MSKNRLIFVAVLVGVFLAARIGAQQLSGRPSSPAPVATTPQGAPTPTAPALPGEPPQVESEAVTAPEAESEVANPYLSPYYRPPRKPSNLAETLDSITPGEVPEHRKQRRNLYFETLSRQMKELQKQQERDSRGEAPPERPTAAPPAEEVGEEPPILEEEEEAYLDDELEAYEEGTEDYLEYPEDEYPYEEGYEDEYGAGY